MSNPGTVSNLNVIKIALIGAPRAGKTLVAELLAGRTPAVAYEATVGVRIVPFQSNAAATKTIEIWDLSGNTEWQSAWLAVADELTAVVGIYSTPEQGKELAIYIQWFINNTKTLGTQDILILALNTPAVQVEVNYNDERVQLLSTTINLEPGNFEQQVAAVQPHFEHLIASVSA